MKTKIFYGLISIVAVHSTFGATEPGLAHSNLASQQVVSVSVTPEWVNRFADELATNNPALFAARARTNAAAAGVKAVRTWNDPVVRIGGMSADRTMREENGDISYGVEQMLPLFGKPRAQRDMASAELAVEVANEDFTFQTLRSDFAKALFRAALADETIAIAEQDLAWLNVTAKVVEDGYRSGTARLMDVLTVQNEQSKRTDQLKTARDNLSHATFVVNRLLDRELTSSWPTLRLPSVAGAVVYSERLTGYALRYEPKLKVMREQIRQAETAVTVARKDRWPDVSVGVQNRNYSGNGELRQTEVMLGFSVPFGNGSKYRAAIRREDDKRKATEFDAKDYQQAIREEVHMLTVKIDAARREALLYRDQIIPRSEQALASAEAMFQSGGALRDVLDARRMLLDGKLMYARAVAEQYEMLSELVLCCGLGDLEALQMIGAQPDSKTETTKP